jgi:hypothetical protein
MADDLSKAELIEMAQPLLTPLHFMAHGRQRAGTGAPAPWLLQTPGQRAEALDALIEDVAGELDWSLERIRAQIDAVVLVAFESALVEAPALFEQWAAQELALWMEHCAAKKVGHAK